MSQNMLPIRFHSLPLNSVRHREVSNLTMDMCERHNSICTIFTTSRSFNDFYTALERKERRKSFILIGFLQSAWTFGLRRQG